MQIDPRIIGAIAAQGGAYAETLAVFAEDYQEQIKHLKESGFPIIERADPSGRVFYCLDMDTATRTVLQVAGKPKPAKGEESKIPTAPPDVKPPADAPQTGGEEPTSEPKPPGPQPPEHPYPGPSEPTQDLEASFLATDFRVQGRDAALPKIILIPASEEAAMAALAFAMRKPRGALVEVSLRVGGEKGTTKARGAVRQAANRTVEAIQARAEKGGNVPIYEYECQACHHQFEELQTIAEGGKAKCPECGGPSDRLISRPQPAIVRENEKRPTEKGKAQLERELSEQVNSGQIPPGLANAQAGLAKL